MMTKRTVQTLVSTRITLPEPEIRTRVLTHTSNVSGAKALLATTWEDWSGLWIDFAAQGLPGVWSPGDSYEWGEADRLPGLQSSVSFGLGEDWEMFQQYPGVPEVFEKMPFPFESCARLNPAEDAKINPADRESWRDHDKVAVLLSYANTFELGRLYTSIFAGAMQILQSNTRSQLCQAKKRSEAYVEVEARGLSRDPRGRPVDPLCVPRHTAAVKGFGLMADWANGVVGSKYLGVQTPRWFEEVRRAVPRSALNMLMQGQLHEAVGAIVEHSKPSSLPSLRQ